MAKMTKTERALATLFVEKGKVALDAIESAYFAGDELLFKHEWEVETDKIARAAMLIGREVAGVADSIVREGGAQ